MQAEDHKTKRLPRTGFSWPWNAYQVLSILVYFSTNGFLVYLCLVSKPFFREGTSAFYLIAVKGLLVLGVSISMVLLMCSDPADPLVYVSEDNPDSSKISVDDANKGYCEFCSCSIRINSKHCKTCNRCVSDFDHHCKFANQCVARTNYCRFISLVIIVTVDEAYSLGVFTGSLWYLILTVPKNIPLVVGSSLFWLVTVIAVYMCTKLLGFQVYLVCANLTTYEYIQKKRIGKVAPTPVVPASPENGPSIVPVGSDESNNEIARLEKSDHFEQHPSQPQQLQSSMSESSKRDLILKTPPKDTVRNRDGEPQSPHVSPGLSKRVSTVRKLDFEGIIRDSPSPLAYNNSSVLLPASRLNSQQTEKEQMDEPETREYHACKTDNMASAKLVWLHPPEKVKEQDLVLENRAPGQTQTVSILSTGEKPTYRDKIQSQAVAVRDLHTSMSDLE